MKDHEDIERKTIDFIYKNFTKYDNSIEIKELYKRIAGKLEYGLFKMKELKSIKQFNNTKKKE